MRTGITAAEVNTSRTFWERFIGCYYKVFVYRCQTEAVKRRRDEAKMRNRRVFCTAASTLRRFLSSALSHELITLGNEEEAKEDEKKAANKECSFYDAAIDVLLSHMDAVGDKAVPG